MKSPADLRLKLRRQWDSGTRREARLLGGASAWPVEVSIGNPPARLVASDLDAVKRHLERWRSVRVGEVVWESVSYRAAADPVEMPVRWRVQNPSEWVRACADPTMRDEFEAMATLAEETDPLFHSALVRRRSLWRGNALAEVIQATRLALALEPGCAAGKPLRTLSLAGIDTKFFERNTRLIIALLDIRFDGEVSRIGLEPFLDAMLDREHWLLVLDLDGALLPFQKQRVPSSELQRVPLPGTHLLIIENESCQHQLPSLPGTIAVLGAGFDLNWTGAPWLQEKQIGYWGDMDTWGLQFLANARTALPHLDALMMTLELFEQHASSAVPEPVTAGIDIPVGLNEEERALYRRLITESRGRLEQEFLPETLVSDEISAWWTSPPTGRFRMPL